MMPKYCFGFLFRSNLLRFWNIRPYGNFKLNGEIYTLVLFESVNPNASQPMNKRCANCRLANFAAAENCVRCDAQLSETSSVVSGRSRNGLGKSIMKRALICLGIIVTLVVGFYVSLIFSSSPLNAEETASLEKALNLLEEKGFDEEVYYLRRFAVFRGSDNWLNSLVPKENAYAATNYPFEIMTVYPDFFTYTEDNVERAAILLHEAKHLQGSEEKEAYEFVWKNRARIGWTKAKYRRSVLWKNVRKQTKEYAPNLFICDFNAYDDCTEDGLSIPSV